MEAGEELFIILDEILKGTNSMDKQKGSFALIKQFMNMNANGIIATHDLLLGTLIDSFPQNIRNYCFEADITNNELTFSYQMRDGVAQNMNACFLMKKNGDSRYRRLTPILMYENQSSVLVHIIPACFLKEKLLQQKLRHL